MSQLLRKYFSKSNEQLKEEQNKNNLQNEIKSLENNYKKQTEEVVTDVWAVAFSNIFPEYNDLVWWINSHKVIAKTLVENLSENELKNILKSKMVDSNIKMNILSNIFKMKKFEIDTNFLKEIEAQNLNYSSENNVKALISNHYRKWIYIFENNFTKIWRVIWVEFDKKTKEYILNFEDWEKIAHTWRILEAKIK